MIAKKFFKQHRNKAVISEKINNMWLGKSQKNITKLVNESILKLKDANVGYNDRVAFSGKNSSEWLAWNLATYSIGGIWVPMYENQPKSYVNNIINDCKPKVLLSNDNTFEFDSYEPNVLSQTLEGNESDDLVFFEPSNDLATLIYTSGTTGPPKGVKLTHNNILSNLESIERKFKYYKSDRSLSILPWAHVYGLTCELYYNLFNDATTFICSDKNNFVKECREVKPNSIYVVPKILDMIKFKIESSLMKHLQPYIVQYILGNNIDIVFTGGAQLSKDTHEFYIRNNILICEGYGCTETAPIISLNGMLDEERNIKTAGKILDNILVTIKNNEICVSGPSVSNGYWNQKPFENYIYKTGDSGFIDEEGFLTITGRISDNYKLSNGKFIDVNKIENKIAKHINGAFMIFGKDQDYNSIISESKVNLNLINNELENYEKIAISYHIDPQTMENFMTPKMSIKKNKLETYIKKLNEK